MAKHIFITGGVVSSLGKGITAASIAMLLKKRGYNVKIQKLDPYINVDPGTMSPFQHGEVYVTEDGVETDLDLGHYERFANITCDKNSNFTTGKIYSNVIKKERAGDYLGQTVQVIPHITDEIKRVISLLDSYNVDIAITEIGGTVGDMESLPFLEAIRQFQQEIGKENCIFIHLTLVPYIKAAGEMKTKPSQQSISILREIGIAPDILVCRCEYPMSVEHIEKLSLFCNVPKQYVIEERDVINSIYEVPMELARQNLDKYILELLKLPYNDIDLTDWELMLEKITNPINGEVNIALVGKYVLLRDAYKSVYEALSHAGIANSVKVNVKMIESEGLETDETSLLKNVSGILVPGGFGDRGVLGKINAIKYARENNIPFLGICLGLHCAIIEFARNVCNIKNANSIEFDTMSTEAVIDLMSEQKKLAEKGGTMRLGSYPCKLLKNSKAYEAYKNSIIYERHRHRYEVNNKYRDVFEKNGLVFSGIYPDKNLVEIIELKEHNWFVACQFHPEFKSSPLNCSPLFRDFIYMAMNKSIK